jgi:tetratricopeptide (TPR) repeat protein
MLMQIIPIRADRVSQEILRLSVGLVIFSDILVSSDSPMFGDTSRDYPDLNRQYESLPLFSDNRRDGTDELYSKGLDAFSKNDFQLAIDFLKRVTEMDPRLPDAFYHLGLAYEKETSLDQAEACFREVLILDPNDPYAKEHLLHPRHGGVLGPDDGIFHLHGAAVSDGTGCTYLADERTSRILKKASDGKWTIFSASPQLNEPLGLALGRNGDLYVANRSGTVLRITPANEVSTMATGLINPYKVTATKDGDIYVTQRGEHPVIRLNKADNH